MLVRFWVFMEDRLYIVVFRIVTWCSLVAGYLIFHCVGGTYELPLSSLTLCSVSGTEIANYVSDNLASSRISSFHGFRQLT
jgi:hypothetical protein